MSIIKIFKQANMANTITIKRDRRFNYDDIYEIDICTTKSLTSDDYARLSRAIKTIQSIFDPHIDQLIWITEEEAKKVKKVVKEE